MIETIKAIIPFIILIIASIAIFTNDDGQLYKKLTYINLILLLIYTLL